MGYNDMDINTNLYEIKACAPQAIATRHFHINNSMQKRQLNFSLDRVSLRRSKEIKGLDYGHMISSILFGSRGQH